MKTLFSLILFFIAIATYSQVNDKSDEIIDPIEQMPIFPGGLDSIWCFLESNLNFEIINTAHDPTKYVIKFYIDTLGQAKGFGIVTTIPRNMHIDSLIKNEIFRVMNLMPIWEPAYQMSKRVKCWFTIPIPTPYIDFKCKKVLAKTGQEKTTKCKKTAPNSDGALINCLSPIIHNTFLAFCLLLPTSFSLRSFLRPS